MRRSGCAGGSSAVRAYEERPPSTHVLHGTDARSRVASMGHAARGSSSPFGAGCTSGGTSSLEDPGEPSAKVDELSDDLMRTALISWRRDDPVMDGAEGRAGDGHHSPSARPVGGRITSAASATYPAAQGGGRRAGLDRRAPAPAINRGQRNTSAPVDSSILIASGSLAPRQPASTCRARSLGQGTFEHPTALPLRPLDDSLERMLYDMATCIAGI